MKKILIIIFAVLVIGGLVWYANGIKKNSPAAEVSADYKNATYLIESQPVTLVNGYAETSTAPDSASKIVTRYFGNQSTGDLNGDGIPDVAFFITQSGGGSGTFYYIAAALKTGSSYVGTNAILLGDRIAPQTTEIKNGELTVNYADRGPNEPMTTEPHLGISKYFKVSGTTLVEIQSNSD